MTDSLLTIADQLYGLVLRDFTPTRDARAKELKAVGEKDLSAQVKALKKPSLAPWVVNCLVRHEPVQVDQLVEVGAALREAAETLDATQLRAFTAQRRQLTAQITTLARRRAADLGQRITPAVADQVESMLTAAMLDADASTALRSGLLVAPFQAVGAGGIDAASVVAVPDALGFTPRPAEPEPEPTRPKLTVVPDPDADHKARVAAREALAEAQAEAARAEAAAQECSAAIADLEAAALRAAAQIEELKRELATAENEAEQVDDDLADAEDAHGDAVAELAEAQREVTRLRAKLTELG